ncbi:hypothetical protein PMAYCL1PPCAC_27397, partial [Pristionchus mayeri]
HAAFTSPWAFGVSTLGIGVSLYRIREDESRAKYDMTEDLAGKTYVVTGATSGIGKAAAEQLAKQNARVILACRNQDKCAKVQQDILSITGNKQVYCHHLDLSDFDSVTSFVRNISKGEHELDRIDGVVHNA